MYHRNQRWSDVITTLAPTLNGATDWEIRERVHRPPGAAGDCQVAYLLLGESYERVGDSGRAKQAFGRLLDIRPPDGDWMLIGHSCHSRDRKCVTERWVRRFPTQRAHSISH